MPAAPDWPKAIMTPAMAKENRNSSTDPPMAAAAPSAFLEMSPRYGCRLMTSDGRSVCACDQSAWAFAPITGQAATLAGGSGTWRL